MVGMLCDDDNETELETDNEGEYVNDDNEKTEREEKEEDLEAFIKS